MRRTCGALEMHLDNGVPFGFAHVGQHAVTKDAGIVDENIETTKCGDGLIDKSLSSSPLADVVSVGNGLSAGGNDFVDNFLCGTLIDTGAIARTAKIVDDDLCALSRQHQRVIAADSSTSTSDDAHPPFTQSCHDNISFIHQSI
ncbi:unannotated protein [freshwater metagenome]|uniref:Unannotated protein n=1 Tax=freshwater metagenome TaxID=449393 RepID=A0A6J6JIH3_9ZZZZ